MRNSDVMAWRSRPVGVKLSIWCVCCSVQGSLRVTCVLVCVCTSVFGHNGGVETLRLLEGDRQRGATAHAQTDHRRGLRGTWAGAQRGVSRYVKYMINIWGSGSRSLHPTHPARWCLQPQGKNWQTCWTWRVQAAVRLWSGRVLFSPKDSEGSASHWLSAGPLLVLIVWWCSSRSQVFTWKDFGSQMKPASVSSPERRRSTRQCDGLQPETRTCKCYNSAWFPRAPPLPPPSTSLCSYLFMSLLTF